MATIQKQALTVKTITKLKKQGVAQRDIPNVLKSLNIKVPSDVVPY